MRAVDGDELGWHNAAQQWAIRGVGDAEDAHQGRAAGRYGSDDARRPGDVQQPRGIGSHGLRDGIVGVAGGVNQG